MIVGFNRILFLFFQISQFNLKLYLPFLQGFFRGLELRSQISIFLVDNFYLFGKGIFFPQHRLNIIFSLFKLLINFSSLLNNFVLIIFLFTMNSLQFFNLFSKLLPEIISFVFGLSELVIIGEKLFHFFLLSFKHLLIFEILDFSDLFFTFQVVDMLF